MKKGKHSSVRWRIVLIYFMLLFAALTILAVYLTNSMRAYQLDSLKENITKTVNQSNLLKFLGGFAELEPYSEEIQQSLDGSWTSGFSQELSVVDEKLRVVASTNSNLKGRNAADVFDSDIIVSALVQGRSTESESQTGSISVKNLCFPVQHTDVSGRSAYTGAVYVRADLSSINAFLSQSRMIFLQAMALALVITVVLGFMVARSITEPINDVTKTVEKMSQGDFSASIAVKSDDEIGQLAEMFNLMQQKLDQTIAEINNEKNKLGTILEYMADGLIAIDLDGNVLQVNPTARHILGIPSDIPSESLKYSEILGHFSADMELNALKDACRDGSGESLLRGDEYTYAVRFDRFKDENGEDVGIIIIMQDMTERQRLEDMQTDFVANVSHELKTPLTNIKSYTETLLDGALDDPDTARNFLQIVDSEADRMNRLVKDLLQLSRMDHGQDPLFLKESNVISLVNMAIMKMELSARHKGLEIRSLYDIEGDIRAMMDRDRMEQVLLNVLSNAIKYTNEGYVSIDVKEQSGQIKIIVSDTGIGIPEASLSRIFERFYRVDKARSRSMGGTGLGLAITKQIVEEHKGSIEAESSEGKGTTVVISLPSVNRKGIRNID
ncbi:MAG: HAMP domain-containing protein [Firmicutes bacterium]|nr:HAMP domain-containing protein [Bacillota bacterium]